MTGVQRGFLDTRASRPAIRSVDIDIARGPVHLMTGEYDDSCMPVPRRATADRFPGSDVTVMDWIGHFPTRENPIDSPPLSSPVLNCTARPESEELHSHGPDPIHHRAEPAARQARLAYSKTAAADPSRICHQRTARSSNSTRSA